MNNQLAASIFLASCLFVGCQSTNDQPTSTSNSAPLVSLDGLVHSLGTIPEGSVKQTFQFRNQHAKPISILPAVTNCACNKVKYSTEQLAPGETLSVDVEFNGKAQSGLTRTHFTIPWASEQQTGAVECFIEATVEFALQMTPVRPTIDPIKGAEAAVVIEQRHGNSKPKSVWSSRKEIECSLSQIDQTHWQVHLTWTEQEPDPTRLAPLRYDNATILVFTEGIGHQQYKIPVKIRQQSSPKIASLSVGD